MEWAACLSRLRIWTIEQTIAESQQGEELRGASTLSQQVTKTLYLWSDLSSLHQSSEAWFDPPSTWILQQMQQLGGVEYLRSIEQ